MKPSRFQRRIYAALKDLGGTAATLDIKHELDKQRRASIDHGFLRHMLFGVGLGSLYIALDELTEAGYLDSWLEMGGPERRFRKKRVYGIRREMEWRELP